MCPSCVLSVASASYVAERPLACSLLAKRPEVERATGGGEVFITRGGATDNRNVEPNRKGWCNGTERKADGNLGSHDGAIDTSEIGNKPEYSHQNNNYLHLARMLLSRMQ